MYRQFFAIAVAAVLLASSSHCRAEDLEFKWPNAQQPVLPQTTAPAKLSTGSSTPIVMPNLNYFSAPPSRVAPTAITARFSTVDLNSFVGSGNDLGAIQAPIAGASRFDSGLTGLVSTAPSTVGQFTSQTQSASAKLLSTPPLLRDTGLNLGTMQGVAPAQYLNDGHQFLSR
jgi:hypothetical protein